MADSAASVNQDVAASETLSPEAPSKNNLRASAAWSKELSLAEKELRQFWERGRRVVRRYISEGEDDGNLNSNKGDKYNIFWANVGVLKANLYANAPKPLVKREWDDFMDDEARVAAIMMERLLNQGLEKPTSDMNVAFRGNVEDRLVPGLGQVWLRYEPEIETSVITPEKKDRKGKVLAPAVTNEKIVNEYACTDYVFWEDFWWSPARTWEEVRWVARRVRMTKPQFTKRFGKYFCNLVTFSKQEPNKYGERITPKSMGVDKTEVFEIWHKSTRQVIWVSRSCDYILDSKGDPLEIEGFFPCPKPLLATHSTASLVPKADYLMVQSQYRRLDNLVLRIGLLEDAIQASGVYDKTNKELGQLLPGNGTNKMIPVDNWAMFGEKGGMKGAVDWFPLEMIVSALDKLREMKTECKAELFELTGISDIMRGQTNARETLGAQEMKAQYSSVRLQYIQGEVAEFIQEALRIKASIISKHFQLETIIRNSNIEMTPDGDMAVAAAQLIKDEFASCYRIQVFADTLAIPDYNAERQGRVEFITAAGQFISQIMPLISIAPQAGPFLLQILQWGVASFRSASSIEGLFDKAITQMVNAQKMPQQPKPDPAMVKADAEVKALEAKTQADLAVKQAKVQADVTSQQAEDKAKALKTAAEISSIQAQTEATLSTKRVKTQAEITATRAKTAAQIAAQLAKLH